jgi:hypothetical protein
MISRMFLTKCPSEKLLIHMNQKWFKSLIAEWRIRPKWTSENRGSYDCSRLRYPSDVTDEEWARLRH